ncbi:hypothetical protein AGDE_13264 [Angomonas deanei]|nr:hypothetical protein AGDE_13264 [Angomonas deanei]|eukprot:EPY22525.1 hypothetical protein AGDE_13264 [Angomonas deanei]
MRSLNVLMPHHVISALQTNMVSIVYLSCSVISVVLGQQPHVKKRGGDTRSNAKRLFLEALDSCVTILLVPFMLFHTPITSLILDGVACSTVLRDVPSCKQFSNKTTFVLSFASLISASVFVPWSIVSQQMRITRLDLRLKVSWLFLMHCVELLGITMWKIFYNSPLKLVFSNIFFHTVSRVVCHYSPPTAYENINRFLYHVSLLPF